MAIRDILVQVGGGDQEALRLAEAADLGKRLGARLTGAHIHAPRLGDMAAGGGDLSWLASAELQRIVAEQEAIEARSAATARGLFEKAASAAVCAHRWAPLDWSAEALLARARVADLIVVGPAADPGLLSPLSADRLACAAGRPVMVLPPVARPVGRRVLVAWNGGREATRALHDALPLLRLAEAVETLSVESADAPRTEQGDLGAHLEAHGVTAKIVRRSAIDPTRAILAEAESFGADLLVMGVYGRSRVSEWVLGGVSRAMLRAPVLPVLMSH